jgi:hypothetical protein
MSTRLYSWIFAGFLLVGLAACGGHNGSDTDKAGKVSPVPDSLAVAEITFDTLDHDFGTIIEGERVVCYFDYRNTGNTELLISSVEATCGCTIPDWNRNPLPSGGTGSLKIIFDSSGREGLQRKVVSVVSNASNRVVRLTIRVQVNKNE